MKLKQQTCIACGKELSLSEFNKCKKSSNGYAVKCRACVNVYRAAYYQKNKQALLDKCRTYYETYRTQKLSYQKIYRQQQGKAKRNEKSRARYHANPTQRVRANKKWCAENKPKRAFLSAQHRALKQKQTPTLSGVEKQHIIDCYKVARAFGNDKNGNACMHVDHIVPVSMGGLHEHSNLQIIPAKVNQTKGDKLNFNIDQHLKIQICYN